MMDDLIDRAALVAEFKRLTLGENSLIERVFADGVYAVIETRPAVDAVEVVRCKDCKHWMKDFAGCTDNVGRCEWANYMVGAAGYCVYGERK